MFDFFRIEGMSLRMMLFLSTGDKLSMIGSPLEFRSFALTLSIPQDFERCVSFLNCFTRLAQSISILEQVEITEWDCCGTVCCLLISLPI